MSIFSAESELFRAIEQGNGEEVKAICLSMTVEHRKCSRDHLKHLADLIKHSHWPAAHEGSKWKAPALPCHYHAHDLATIACGEPSDLLTLVEYVGVRWDEASELLASLGKDPDDWRRQLGAAVAKALKGHVWAIEPAQRLIAAGLTDRPSTSDYTIGLIAWPRCIHWQSPGGLEQRLRNDPGIHAALLQLFVEQGTSEFNLATMDKYAKANEGNWAQVFLDGITLGHYTRPLLLEKTLSTLESDWPQMRAGWFSRFHQLLAPSVEEMKPFVDKYLALTHSRIPPTVSLALEALLILRDSKAVSNEDLLEALVPVFYANAKSQIVGAFNLVKAIATDTPTLRSRAVDVAIPGLLHPASDVQSKLLKFFAEGGLTESQRSQLAGYQGGIALALQPLLEDITGHPAQAEPSKPNANAHGSRHSIASSASKPDPFNSSRKLHLYTFNEIGIEAIAHALENPDNIDGIECAIAALVQAAPISSDLRSQCATIVKRSRKIKHGTLAYELARLVLFVCADEKAPNIERQIRARTGGNGMGMGTPRERLSWRIDNLIEQAGCGLSHIPLSTPSHQGGFLSQEEWRRRLTDLKEDISKISTDEQALAELRTQVNRTDQPRFTWEVQKRTSRVGDKEYHFHDFHIAHEGTELKEPYLEYLKPADLRYQAYTSPGRLEQFFAEGALALARNIDWWEARWCNQSYIERLLLPFTPIKPEFPMAVLCLALALGGKEAGQTAMAVDALIASNNQNRIDAKALGATLNSLFRTDLPKAKRYAKSFGDALRGDPTVAPLVFACVCDIVRAHGSRPIKDLAALLDVLLEAGLIHRLTLPTDLSESLQGSSGSATLRTKIQDVLSNLA